MLTVQEHETRPVLSGVNVLRLVVHFDRFGRPVIVRYHEARFCPVGVVKQSRDVPPEKKIAVYKDRPAGVPREVWSQKPREAELRRLERIDPTPIDTLLAQIVLLYGGDVERD
jgi:hypothetical protein